jgi:hypothetical protein
MVWFFRQTFCKKALHNSVNQPIVQSLINPRSPGLLPRLSRQRQTAALPPLPQTRSACGRPTACGRGRPTACGSSGSATDQERVRADGRRCAGTDGRRRAGARVVRGGRDAAGGVRAVGGVRTRTATWPMLRRQRGSMWKRAAHDLLWRRCRPPLDSSPLARNFPSMRAT